MSSHRSAHGPHPRVAGRRRVRVATAAGAAGGTALAVLFGTVFAQGAAAQGAANDTTPAPADAAAALVAPAAAPAPADSPAPTTAAAPTKAPKVTTHTTKPKVATVPHAAAAPTTAAKAAPTTTLQPPPSPPAATTSGSGTHGSTGAS